MKAFMSGPDPRAKWCNGAIREDHFADVTKIFGLGQSAHSRAARDLPREQMAVHEAFGS
jgi:hypothetical protein